MFIVAEKKLIELKITDDVCISQKYFLTLLISLDNDRALQIFNIFFGGRYVIFLMGLFSLYTGAFWHDLFMQLDGKK